MGNTEDMQGTHKIQQKIDNPMKKWTKLLNRYFSEDIQIVNGHMGKTVITYH